MAHSHTQGAQKKNLLLQLCLFLLMRLQHSLLSISVQASEKELKQVMENNNKNKKKTLHLHIK